MKDDPGLPLYSASHPTDTEWCKEHHVCPDCVTFMGCIGTFRKVPQWLCANCGWVAIGEKDARWV